MAKAGNALADYNEPLTAEEQEFAAECHDLIWAFLNKNRLDEREYYDAAALGYLKAVKKYVNVPRLRKYEFSTIAFNAMKTSVCNHRRAEHSRTKNNISGYDNPDFDFIESIADSRDEYEDLCISITVTSEIEAVFNILDDTQKKLFILQSQGYTQAEIAEIMGYKSKEVVSKKLSWAREKTKSYLNGEKKDRTRGEDMGAANKIDYEQIKLLYEQGLNDSGIAIQLKCSVYSVKTWRQSMKLPANDASSEAKVTALTEDKRAGLLMKLVNPDDEPEVVKLFSELTIALSNQQIRRHFRQYGKETKS